MKVEVFQDLIRKNRREIMPTPRELVEEALRESPYYNQEQSYYLNNIDEVLFGLRTECWKTYLKHEQIFNTKVTDLLIQGDTDLQNIEGESPRDIIGTFLAKYNNHLFELSKSNTNSRRARAGKEFEIILEKILLHIGVPFDDQGVIGSKLFEKARLGKIVDCVVPGVVEYNIERRRCALISMKTSLRERWQEVPEELARTGASEMFLFTLDDTISDNTIESLNTHNITLVVPNKLKEENYDAHYSVYGLTHFLKELIKINGYWLKREDLPEEYYENKLETTSLHLDDVTDDYENELYDNLRKVYLGKLNKL